MSAFWWLVVIAWATVGSVIAWRADEGQIRVVLPVVIAVPLLLAAGAHMGVVTI